ncbi:hypothetical protein CHS0354_007676 [Potamilus streckersoni]|uniref:Uncharacterized protein n=1 Tax=Potamilus streckersoni TaxID=2493646 RepID=A0AAE0SI19_9BIVA|nr:hypothetical protein CHS0354_007676 [Potamilus streckersoni]
MVVMTDGTKVVQCCIVGDGMVGKTCLALNFVQHRFPKDYVATVFENYAGILKISSDEYVVSIFDSAGQQDYEGLRAFTYKDSEVYVVCYSVVDRESFESVKQFWVPEIEKYMGRKKPIILIGTQTDMRNTTDYDMDIPVSTKEGSALAKDIGADLFLECACQNHNSSRKVFENVVLSALKYRKKKSTIVHKIFGK